jgi:hypothetical protein
MDKPPALRYTHEPETGCSKRQRQKVKGKRQKAGAASFLLKAVSADLLPFYTKLQRKERLLL